MKFLRYQWLAYAILALSAHLATYALIRDWFPNGSALAWFLLSASCQLYFLFVLAQNLSKNCRPGETAPLTTFGWANALTLGRMTLMSLFVGLLVLPAPIGWVAWLPGLLYTAAALPDYVDGYLARRTNHVTALGEILDMTTDSIGVLAATGLAAKYGVVPAWYLSIGMARYIFFAGLLWRERRGKPIHDLPYSLRRRGFAALKMGFIFFILLPFFGPPGTHIAAYAFGIPFLLGFFWDWGVVSGRLRATAWKRFLPQERFFRRILPVGLRVAIPLLALPGLMILWGSDVAIEIWLALATTIFALALVFGLVGRLSAILALTLLAPAQLLMPLSAAQQVLIVIYIGILMLGTGRFSLWPIDERVIQRRPGDPVAADQAI